MDLGSLELKPAVRQTLCDSVTDSLRDAILGRELTPGFPLPEAKLAVRLGVSRAPVREALSILEREGLVERGSRGMLVAKLTRADVDEISSLRLALEQLAVRKLVLQRSQIDWAPLTEIIERTRRVRQAGEAGELDVAFHEALVRAADHGRLLAAWQALRSQIRLLLLQMDEDDREFAQHTADAHTELLEVLRQGTGDEAAALIEQHLKSTHEQVARHCEG